MIGAAAPGPSSEPAARATPETRIARAGLLRMVEPPSAAMVQLVAEVGPEQAWDLIVGGHVPQSCRRAVAARTQGLTASQLQAAARRDLDAVAELGGEFICPEDPQWPAAAFDSFQASGSGLFPPLGVYLRGTGLPLQPSGAVTIVGSRASTEYGRRCASEIAAELAAHGLTIVSGAAFGIDAAAHRGALSVRGRGSTAAVLACGIDIVYPVAHRELVAEIADRGALLSEYPPGTTPARHRFLARNRLIAALASVTVVVEAGRRSGTVSTANAAAALNRVVMAVPGPVTSAMSVGCHDLLRSGQVVIATNGQDVLEAAGVRTALGAHEVPHRLTDDLSPVVGRVYEALPGSGTRTVRELATEAGIPAVEVIAALAELDLVGLARADSGTWGRR